MDKKTELRVCDWLLLAMTVAVLVSSIQLEVTAVALCRGCGFMWSYARCL